MKSAKEWAIEFEWENPSDASGRSEIEAIQRDALLHAAKICRDNDDGPRAFRIARAVRAIEAEARKVGSE